MSSSKTRPNDAVQIQAGWYVLRQSDEQVGKLFVEDLTSPGASREHWLLYSSYQWPSADFPNQAIQFVKQTSSVTLSGFLEGAPSTATYIIANCQKQ